MQTLSEHNELGDQTEAFGREVYTSVEPKAMSRRRRLTKGKQSHHFTLLRSMSFPYVRETHHVPSFPNTETRMAQGYLIPTLPHSLQHLVYSGRDTDIVS